MFIIYYALVIFLLITVWLRNFSDNYTLFELLLYYNYTIVIHSWHCNKPSIICIIQCGVWERIRDELRYITYIQPCTLI